MIVTSQKEWDALPASFDIYTRVEIRSPAEQWLSVSKIPGNAYVVARESSHVEARGSSHVEARGSSHVVAWGSSHVVARESSHVVAWGSSHVEAWGSVSVHAKSEYSSVDLFGFAVAILIAKCKLRRKSRTCSVVRPKQAKGTNGWLESQAVEEQCKKVVLFKRVSADFKTQEGTTYETLWALGSTLEHPDWKPKKQECGANKFHACSRAYFCDEFRDVRGDKYIAIEVATKDLFAWPSPSYPHKIAFRKGTVLHECDRYGRKVA